MAAPLKEFWDESVKIRPSLEGKLGAAIATAGHHTGGKETTMLSIHQAMLIHGMLIVGDPISTGGHYGAACHGRVSDAALKARVGQLVQKLFG
jgi:NAD(P)H dehydrogenase (quinone)